MFRIFSELIDMFIHVLNRKNTCQWKDSPVGHCRSMMKTSWLWPYAHSALAPQNLPVFPTMRIRMLCFSWDLLWMSPQKRWKQRTCPFCTLVCFPRLPGLWSNDQNRCFHSNDSHIAPFLRVWLSLLDISITNLTHLLTMQQIHSKGWEAVGIVADKANFQITRSWFQILFYFHPSFWEDYLVDEYFPPSGGGESPDSEWTMVDEDFASCR